MCGIYVSISRGQPERASEQLKSRLRSRGPDAEQLFETSITSAAGERISILFYATVLSLRGEVVVSQPLISQTRVFESPSFLCWNGEAWSIDSKPVAGNDSESVLRLLENAVDPDYNGHSPSERVSSLETALQKISGPFAFVYLDGEGKRLYFGRDVLGRRSLLRCTTSKGLMLTSVGDDEQSWTEVNAAAVYAVDLSNFSADIIESIAKAQDDCPSEINGFQSYTSRTNFNLNRREPSTNCDLMHIDHPSVVMLKHLLDFSLTSRLGTLQKRVLSETVEQPRIAVLFSGGVDCTLLARLCHDHLPGSEPIDLVNVAFENPHVQPYQSLSAFDMCPDRTTARTSLCELQEQCPTRKWHLVEIDVPHSEVDEHRAQVISLMRPHATEMDFSIALALYFAARGVGRLSPRSNEINLSGRYETPARVLISGLGADELFGGYQRHATAFSRRGYAGLFDELALDVSRLGKRNLGRDDRVLSHWGREARYPFLDQRLVHWAVQLPIEEKCGFGVEQATSLEDGKLLLRMLALRLGMSKVAHEKKRAIQFGARTAKLSSRKSKGTDAIT